MNDTIKLDIISDITCPWCIIGYKRVMQAITEMDVADRVEIEWHPFQLNPEMPSEGEDVRGHMAKKYGMTPEDTEQTLNQITTFAAEMGFTIDLYDGFKMVNTQDLHILLEYAKEYGKQTELKLRLFAALFTEHKNVSDRKVLAQELEKVGLDISNGMARLNDETFRKKAQDHEQYWKSLGVSAVPTMVFENSGALVGAQPVDTYKQVLGELLEPQLHSAGNSITSGAPTLRTI